MPLYDFKCQVCDNVEEHIAKVEETLKTCPCGGPMKRLITTNYHVYGDMQPYIDEHIGDRPIHIKNRQHRQQMMKECGVYEKVGKGWI